MGKWVCIGFFVFFAWQVQDGLNKYVTISIRKSDARDITTFTAEIRRLVAQGKNEKANELLDKFNDKYPALSGHDEAKKFIEDLTQTAKKN